MGVFAVEIVDEKSTEAFVEVAHELITDVSVEIVDELTKRVIDESTNGVFVEFAIEGTTVDFVVEVNDE